MTAFALGRLLPFQEAPKDRLESVNALHGRRNLVRDYNFLPSLQTFAAVVWPGQVTCSEVRIEVQPVGFRRTFVFEAKSKKSIYDRMTN